MERGAAREVPWWRVYITVRRYLPRLTGPPLVNSLVWTGAVISLRHRGARISLAALRESGKWLIVLAGLNLLGSFGLRGWGLHILNECVSARPPVRRGPLQLFVGGVGMLRLSAPALKAWAACLEFLRYRSLIHI